MKRITSRFMMLIATAAVLPLIVYGFVSMGRLRRARKRPSARATWNSPNRWPASSSSTSTTTPASSARSARRSAHEPRAVATDPYPHQSRAGVPRSSASSSLLDASGRTMATSRLGGSRAKLPAPGVRSTRAFTSRTCSSTTTRCRRLTCLCDWAERPGMAGRPALARGAVALRRHRPRRPAGLRAGLFRRPATDRPWRSGQEAAGGAGRNGPGQPAVRGRRPGRRRPSHGCDYPRNLRR